MVHLTRREPTLQVVGAGEDGEHDWAPSRLVADGRGPPPDTGIARPVEAAGTVKVAGIIWVWALSLQHELPSLELDGRPVDARGREVVLHLI